jgi:hypothetical protein
MQLQLIMSPYLPVALISEALGLDTSRVLSNTSSDSREAKTPWLTEAAYRSQHAWT